MTFTYILLIEVRKNVWVPLVKLYFPRDNLPMLRGLYFKAEIDEKGRLVLIGPEVSRMPSVKVDQGIKLTDFNEMKE